MRRPQVDCFRRPIRFATVAAAAGSFTALGSAYAVADRETVTRSAIALSSAPSLELSFTTKSAHERWPHLWTAHSDGSHARQLEHRPGDKQAPHWSPDGKRVALRWLPSGDYTDSELVVMSVDGTHWLNLTERTRLQGWSPAWSPDGKHLVVAATRSTSQKPALYVMRPDGSMLQRITRGGQEDQYPSWSPDGGLIAFHRVTSRGGFDLYTVRPDGSDLERLTNGGGFNQWPMWSPDGRQIAFGRENGTRPGIWVMNRDGSNKRLVTHRWSSGVPGAWAPAQRITFQCRIPTTQQVGICQADAGGNHFRLLLAGRDAGFPGWRKR